MTATRLFLSQDTLDLWLAEERVTIDGETLTLGSKGSFQLVTAFHFLEELAGGGDESQLVGKVKSLVDVEALGGEHCADSVIRGKAF